MMKNNLAALVGFAGAVLPLGMRNRAARTLAFAVLACSAAWSQDRAQSAKNYAIEFVNIVDSTAGFASFGDFPAINNHGEVAFTALHNGAAPGVFRARDGMQTIATIASDQDGLSFFGADVAINAAGVVAFGASTSAGSRTIWKADGNSKTLIVDSTAAGLFKIAVGSPSINAAGTVAFSAPFAQRGLPAAVFTGNGGALTTVAATSATGFGSFGNVAINNAGTVVFAGNLRDRSHGVFTASRTLVDIVDTNTHPEIDSFGDPVINEAGAVADVAFLSASGAPLIFTATAHGITPRNNPANPAFTNSEHPSINNSGAVAFSVIALFPGTTDPTGIFLELSGGESLVAVVRPGDKLFGSTVDHVDLGRFALNDRFQLAFSYTLTDGRSGIAIASFNGESQH